MAETEDLAFRAGENFQWLVEPYGAPGPGCETNRLSGFYDPAALCAFGTASAPSEASTAALVGAEPAAASRGAESAAP